MAVAAVCAYVRVCVCVRVCGGSIGSACAGGSEWQQVCSNTCEKAAVAVYVPGALAAVCVVAASL